MIMFWQDGFFISDSTMAEVVEIRAIAHRIWPTCSEICFALTYHKPVLPPWHHILFPNQI